VARRYDIVYPPKGRVVLDGGLNNKFERSQIDDNETPDCAGVVFGSRAAETWGGASKLNATAIGSFVGDGLYTRHDDAGAETMVAFAGGTAWTWEGATFATIASAQSVFTAGVRVAAAEYENHMFIGNGGVTPYKYNGTDFTRHGVPAASGAVSIVTAGTGTAIASATVSYKITYVNSNLVEGDVGSATASLAIVAQNVHLTDIPTAPQSHGVNARRIYRDDDGAGYLRVAEINDNTTTTYEDAITALGAAAPTDQGEPPKYSVLVAHHDRVFCDDSTNRNYLWYSDLGEPFTYGSTNFFKVGDATSDLIEGVAVYNDALVIRCTKSIWMLLFNGSSTPSDWQLVRLRVSYGDKSPFGAFLYNNKLMIPAMDSDKFVGWVALSGSSIDPDATFLENAVAGGDKKSDRIEPSVFQVQEAYVGNITSQVFKNKAYISVTHGNGNTTNNRAYVFDYSKSTMSKNQEASWSPIDSIAAADFTIYDGKLYYISATDNGTVYQAETDVYTDGEGAAINSYIWTKEFSGNKGDENIVKDFRKLFLLVEMAGAYYMSVTYRVDSDKGQGKTKQISLDPGSSIWSTMRWGIDTWGGGSDQEEIKVYLPGARGKRIQFKFSNQNTASRRFKVHGLNFTYNKVGRR